jgi:hypothetical protein
MYCFLFQIDTWTNVLNLCKFFNIRFRYIVFFRNLQRGLSLARWVAKHRPERPSPIHHNIICCAVVCVEIWELLPESMYLHMNDTLHEQLDSPLPNMSTRLPNISTLSINTTNLLMMSVLSDVCIRMRVFYSCKIRFIPS